MYTRIAIFGHCVSYPYLFQFPIEADNIVIKGESGWSHSSWGGHGHPYLALIDWGHWGNSCMHGESEDLMQTFMNKSLASNEA